MAFSHFAKVILDNPAIKRKAGEYFNFLKFMERIKLDYDVEMRRGALHNELMRLIGEKVPVDFDNDREEIHESVMEIFQKEN